MDKLDYAILEIMIKKCGAVTKLSAATRKNIQSEMDISLASLYGRLTKLINAQCLANGIREFNSLTYYVTEKGAQTLEEAKN